MKKALVSLLFLSACFSKGSMMTRETFENIDLGTPANQVVAEAGKPYAVHPLPGDKKEYEYIERIEMGNQILMENHYFLTISEEGQVVSKRIKTEKPPAYNILYEADPNYPNYRNNSP